MVEFKMSAKNGVTPQLLAKGVKPGVRWDGLAVTPVAHAGAGSLFAGLSDRIQTCQRLAAAHQDAEDTSTAACSEPA
jgi:hypothetical protein